MRKSIIIFTLSVLFISCEKRDNKNLIQEIESLRNENKELKNSLTRSTKTDYDKLISSELILLPSLMSFSLHDENIITGVFSQRQKLPSYSLYLADENYDFEEKDKLNFQILDDNKFEFNFTPKTKKDESVRIVAIFDLDSISIQLFGQIDLPVK